MSAQGRPKARIRTPGGSAAATAGRKRGGRRFDARELLASLPHRPGVYRMFNAAGETLYVGKARDLKKRVSSYFQKSGHEVADRDDGGAGRARRNHGHALRRRGAAAREQPHQGARAALQHPVPRRQELSVRLPDRASTFPQLRFHRGALDRRNRYFGPFPGAGAVREGIALLQKVFMLRTCDDTVFANRSRPCMLYQIQRCTAPCVGFIAEEEYREDVQGATLFLQGRAGEVLTQMQAQMEAAAAALEFERAARFRDRISRLQQLQSRQFVESATAGDIDVVAAAFEGGLIAVNVVMIRGGRHVGDRTIFPRHADALNVGIAGDDRAGVPRAALCRAAGAADDHRARRAGPRRARGSAVGAIVAEGGDRRQSRRRAPRLADDGAAERDAGDPPAARAEGDAGGSPRRIAGGARVCRPRRSASSASTSRTRWARRRSRRA